MALSNIDGLMWLLLLLGPLLLLQRILHREIQMIFMLITRRADVAVALYSLLLFPGVLLHEVSHFIMAKLVGVQTGRVSLLPRTIEGNRLQLGFVETAKTDLFRDALIGGIPLISGCLFVAYVGIWRLGLLGIWDALASTDLAVVEEAIAAVYGTPDFWLWFYLLVAVSSTMFPSQSDRRAWLPTGGVLLLIFGLALLFGGGPWMSTYLLPGANDIMRGLAIVFAISAVVHFLVVVPALLIRKGISSATGLKFES